MSLDLVIFKAHPTSVFLTALLDGPHLQVLAKLLDNYPPGQFDGWFYAFQLLVIHPYVLRTCATVRPFGCF